MIKFIKILCILSALVLTTACNNAVYADSEQIKSDDTAYSPSSIDTQLNSGNSGSFNSEESGVINSDSEISLSTSTPKEKPTISNEAQNIKTVDFSSKQSALKGYIKFARSEISSGFLNGDECAITLRNVYGNEKPEMIIAIKENRRSLVHECYFSTNDNDEPIYLRGFSRDYDSFYTDIELGDFYMDSLNKYYIIYSGKRPSKDNLYWTSIDRLDPPIEGKVSPDFAEYQNSDALDFVWGTHMYFIRYDNGDFDGEKQTWKNPEELAAMFYYEDSGLYEAYSVSKQMLDLTAFEIKDYINDEGNHIYSYLPGENYLVSRREYEQIKSKVFEILTEVTDEPVISSGWIDIDDIDKWLDSLT